MLKMKGNFFFIFRRAVPEGNLLLFLPRGSRSLQPLGLTGGGGWSRPPHPAPRRGIPPPGGTPSKIGSCVGISPKRILRFAPKPIQTLTWDRLLAKDPDFGFLEGGSTHDCLELHEMSEKIFGRLLKCPKVAFSGVFPNKWKKNILLNIIFQDQDSGEVTGVPGPLAQRSLTGPP